MTATPIATTMGNPRRSADTGRNHVSTATPNAMRHEASTGVPMWRNCSVFVAVVPSQRRSAGTSASMVGTRRRPPIRNKGRVSCLPFQGDDPVQGDAHGQNGAANKNGKQGLAVAEPQSQQDRAADRTDEDCGLRAPNQHGAYQAPDDRPTQCGPGLAQLARDQQREESTRRIAGVLLRLGRVVDENRRRGKNKRRRRCGGTPISRRATIGKTPKPTIEAAQAGNRSAQS